MLKLMKYEFRKQLFSKFAILGILGILEAWFLVALLMGKEASSEKATVFLILLAVIGIFYVSFECIFTFSNDLRTKQSYMLFMVPESTYSIMGAKVLSAMIQIILTGLVFGVVAFFDIMAIFAKYGELKEFVEGVVNVLNEFLHLEIETGRVVVMLTSMVVSWGCFVVSGMFSIALSATFMANNRLKGVVSFAIFIVLVSALSKIGSKITGGLFAGYAEYIGSIVFTLAVTVVLYLGTAWMLEKKVSV